MHPLSTRRFCTGFIWKTAIFLIISAIFFFMAAPRCRAEQPNLSPVSEDNSPEPAPEGSVSEEMGMITPPSDSSQEGVFFGGSTAGESSTDEKLETLLSQLTNSLPSGNGSWSVYVCDLVNDSEGSIEDHSMQAASLIKLYIMGAVYENYETLTEQYGKDNVDSCLYSMITVSDNNAANTLTGYLGGGDSSAGMTIVNDFCMAHGYTRTSMGRLLLQSNEYGDNYTSVSDCGHFLKAVYQGNSSEYPYADTMLSLLAAQTRRHKIPAQIPSDVTVANKTGELSDVENDAGIIYNAKNDLIIVFMSENLGDVGAAQNSIASISHQIYSYYNE